MGKPKKDKEQFLKLLGKRIQEVRKEKKVSLRELAMRCDMEKPNVTRLQNGKANPNIATLRKVCIALDISLEELLRFDS